LNQGVLNKERALMSIWSQINAGVADKKLWSLVVIKK